MTKKERRRLSIMGGLPIDARNWTEKDWQDLHEAIEKVKRRVAERHRRRNSRKPPNHEPGENQ